MTNDLPKGVRDRAEKYPVNRQKSDPCQCKAYDCFIEMAEENAYLAACEKEALPLVRALQFRLRHGCNDTCSKQLSAEYSCTCGQDHAVKALAHWTGDTGEGGE